MDIGKDCNIIDEGFKITNIEYIYYKINEALNFPKISQVISKKILKKKEKVNNNDNKKTVTNNLKNKKNIVKPNIISNNNDNVEDIIEEKIVGTSTQLLKPFLRHTSDKIDPATIRPLPMLEKGFYYLLNLIQSKKNTDKKFILDQFRSLRQDLIIQGIENEFTIKVFEFSIKFALIFEDLEQYVLCSKTLIDLYKHNDINDKYKIRKYEFYYYWVLYLSLNSSYNELNTFLITTNSISNDYIAKGLLIKKNLMIGNYNFILKLLKNDSMEIKGLLMCFINKIRVWALQNICC